MFKDVCTFTNGQFLVRDNRSFRDQFKLFSHCKVIARCTPKDKHFIVKLLQAMAAQVAFVGYSQVDSYALKDATVGISLKQSCDIAKDESDLVLLKNDFSQIRVALMWGRNLVRNM